MVLCVCFHAITFITVDLFPWNFNNDPSYKIKHGIENGGSVSTCLKTRGPKGMKLVFSYFRVYNVYFLSDFDAVFSLDSLLNYLSVVCQRI